MDEMQPILIKISKFCNQRTVVVLLILASVLYGASYQQFRHFNIENSEGLSDVTSYVKMSYGDYNVSETHKYRFIIPVLSSQVRFLLKDFISDRKELDKLSFYIVNYSIILSAGLLFFQILQKMGFNVLLSIIGACCFLTSRITILSTGAPLVDSLYFWAIALIGYCLLYNKYNVLSIMNPILILSKETILPFLFLPLFKKGTRKPQIFISLVASIILMKISRTYLDKISGAGTESEGTFIAVVYRHLEMIGENFFKFLTVKGVHNAFNGFSFLLLLALFGLLIHLKEKKYDIPIALWLTVPFGLGFALLSSNFGRMIFSAYVVVIPMALVFVESSLDYRN
jgi:hypothetical protein